MDEDIHPTRGHHQASDSKDTLRARIRDLERAIAQLQGERAAQPEPISEPGADASRERYYRSLLHALHEDIVVIDRDYRITDVNNEYLATVGLARDEVIGRFCYELSHRFDAPCDQHGEECRLRDVFETGEACNCHHIHTVADGRRIDVDILLSPLKDEAGQVTHVIEAMRDVSDLFEAHRALRESQETLSVLLNAPDDAIMLTDLQGTILAANTERMGEGGLRADAIGANVFDLLPPALAASRKALFEQVIQTGEQATWEDEDEGVIRDNRIFPIFDAEGNVVRLAGFTRDITERRRTEQALRSRTRELETLYEAGRQISRSLDRETIYQSFHKWLAGAMDCDALVISSYDAREDILHCEFTMVDGKQVDASLLPPIPLPSEGKGTQSVAIRTGEPLLIPDYQAHLAKSVTMYHVSANGTLCDRDAVPEDEDITRSALIIPMKFEDRVVGAIQVQSYRLNAFSDDDLRMLESLASQITVATNNALLYQRAQDEISERIRAEESLWESEVRLAYLTQQAPVAVFSADRDLRMTYHSGAITTRLADMMKQGKIIGHTLPEIYEDLLDPETAARQLRYLRRVLQGETVHYTHVHGGQQNENVLSPLRDEAGNIVGLVGVAMDVTERHTLEEQLRQSQKFEALGTLAGGVAHDFNNLLTTIIGFTELALRETDETMPQYSDLVQVRKTAQRAADLTRQLLLFSRRQPVAMAPIDVSAVTENVLKMLGRLLGEDIAIQTELDEDPWTIMADAGQIEQVIMNLAANARDAMPDGGAVTIRMSNVEIGADAAAADIEARPGRFVCLSIEDQGSGMDDETLSRIFEPFFTTKAAGQGSGLGLAVVYGIVKRHGGWIDVASVVGQGTRFDVYLPALQTEQRAAPDADIDAIDLRGAGERILLIEDEDIVRTLADRLLTGSGYVVFSAGSVAEALGLFEQEGGDFALIFSDVVLPDGNGPNLVRQLQARRPDLPALFATGYLDDRAQRVMGDEFGHPVLNKPYTPAGLRRAVADVLGRADAD